MNRVPWQVIRSLEILELTRQEISECVFPDRELFLYAFGLDGVEGCSSSLRDREVLAAADRLFGPVA